MAETIIIKRPGFSKFANSLAKISIEQQKSIIDRYVAGERTGALAKEFSVTHGRITGIMIKAGVCRKEQWNFSNRLPLRQDAFAKITPESAYWIGFLMADGSVGSKRTTIKLYLAEEDKEHIQKFKDFLGSGHKIIHYSRKPWNGYKRQDAYGITVNSKQMVQDLAKYGVTPRKSATAKVIQLENDPHFWRGVIDGDGSLFRIMVDGRKYPSISLCGSNSMCCQFLNFAKDHTKTKSSVHKDTRGDLYYISFGGSIAAILIKILYKDANTFLKRKYDKAHELLLHYSSVREIEL